ncbi:MAG: complexed with cef1p [Cirrosporium novae-zelandiae]|nr:MAG: complexed with cef1p [Cirrosporium novae-zelandiae]
MTTAHRPTFDPARGREAQRGPAYHQRMLPAYTHLKTRQPGQGNQSETSRRDLRAELLEAEAAHYAKVHGGPPISNGEEAPKAIEAPKRPAENEDGDEDPEAKRRRILEETRDIDADSDGDDSDSSEEDSDEDDDEDETAELMRELEKIKRERAEQREKEEREKAEAEAEKREQDIAMGNPLLNPRDFTVKRRWDDDVIFKNQARGTESNKKKEFVNDLQRSEFHKRFLNKYVR